MRVCIPTIDDQGPNGLPSAHFGASPFLTFFDLDTGDWEAVPNGSSGHQHGACRPLDALTGRPVDAVLCQGLGRGAFARLQQAGIAVYLAREPDTAGCLEAYRAGRLPRLIEAQLCHGHGHAPEFIVPGRGRSSRHEDHHGSRPAQGQRDGPCDGQRQGRGRAASHE